MRKLLEGNIKKLTAGYDRVAVSCSGGTDSNCIIFSCLALGIKPVLYTYEFEGILSPDMVNAEKVASCFDLELVKCTAPTDLDIIADNVYKIIRAGLLTKVYIQCMQGNLYIAPKVKEKVLLNGSGIDGVYGVLKSMAILRKKPLEFRLAQERELNHINDKRFLKIQAAYYKQYGIDLFYPYCYDNIYSYLKGRTFDEMNSPKYKWIMVKHYQEYYNQVKGLYCPRGSHQIRSGAKDLNEQLLSHPINQWGCKSVIKLYNNIAKEIGWHSLKRTRGKSATASWLC